MIASVFFIFNRLVEIVFLIPIIGMLVRSIPSSPVPVPNQSSLTNHTGLLRRWLHQSKHADPILHLGPLHRQHHRRFLGRRHSDPVINHEALCNLRRLHRPLLLRCIRRSRLPAALHRQCRLRKLERRLRLDLPGSIRLVRPAHR